MLTEELMDLYIHRKSKIKEDTVDAEEELLFEFKMLWWVANPAAPGFKMGLPLKVTLDKAKDEFAPKGWRSYAIFATALGRYIELMEEINPIYSLLKSHVVALKTSTKTVSIMTATLSEYVNTFKLKIEDETSVKTLGNIQDILKGLLSDGDKLNDRIKSFKVISDAYGKEEAKLKSIRGGHDYHDSMDADNDIER
ncbi:hypothetical protein KAU11_11375 [Candidatus Babeliales bacterium]|nr:hypothetical protein [Candidatus Babeliales bacterium]